jgi:AbrB family looped-hinge helix DNA binding protein
LKRYPKLVQCDSRGQIVIPKEIRQDLGVEEGTGFWMYTISEEGILLKKIESPELEQHKIVLDELKQKSNKVGVTKKNIEKAEKNYKKTKKGSMEIV